MIWTWRSTTRATASCRTSSTPAGLRTGSRSGSSAITSTPTTAPSSRRATTDKEGQPQCSYKGGDPGFVRVLDERTIAFPVYDGNGMYLTAGNMVVQPQVGLLFIDFEGRKRVRLNGVASVLDDDPLLAEYPEAQLVVRVDATEVFPNCPRYIHQYELVARSRFVPKERCETPVPQWKRSEWAHDVLSDDDPANDPTKEVIQRG